VDGMGLCNALQGCATRFKVVICAISTNLFKVALRASTAITWSVTTALRFRLSATSAWGWFWFLTIIIGLYRSRLHRLLLKSVINHPCYNNDEDEAEKV